MNNKKKEKIEKAMKKYYLTFGDLPVLPPKDIDLEKFIIAIGKARKKLTKNL